MVSFQNPSVSARVAAARASWPCREARASRASPASVSTVQRYSPNRSRSPSSTEGSQHSQARKSAYNPQLHVEAEEGVPNRVSKLSWFEHGLRYMGRWSEWTGADSRSLDLTGAVTALLPAASAQAARRASRPACDAAEVGHVLRVQPEVHQVIGRRAACPRRVVLVVVPCYSLVHVVAQRRSAPAPRAGCAPSRSASRQPHGWLPPGRALHPRSTSL